MINNEEKIAIIMNKLDNLDKIVASYIDHAEVLKDKYSLEDMLLDCNAKRDSLLKELELINKEQNINPYQ